LKKQLNLLSKIESSVLEGSVFTEQKLITIISLGILYGIQIEFLSKNPIGFVISILTAIFLISISIKNLSFAFFFILHFLIITPIFPRNLALFRIGETTFHTIYHDKIFGLTFIQFIFISVFLKAIIEGFKNKESLKAYNKYIIFFLVFTICLLISSIKNLSDPLPVGFFRQFISDMKFPLLLAAGFLVALYSFKSTDKFYIKLKNVLVISFFIVSVRAIFFLLIDIFSGEINIYFGENAGFVLPIFFLLFLINFENKKMGYLLFLCSGLILIPKGRADILFIFILFIITLYCIKVMNDKEILKQFKIKTIYFTVSIIIAVVALILVANQVIFFILNKFDFFSTEIFSKLSISPGTRIVEFKNIFLGNLEDGIFGVLFGQGAGGYFKFIYTPMNYIIDISAYSTQEISNNIFFSPHTFVNYFILKAGFIGLTLYISVFFMLYKNYKAHTVDMFKCYLLLNIPILFWKSFSVPTLSFYLGALLAMSITSFKSKTAI